MPDATAYCLAQPWSTLVVLEVFPRAEVEIVLGEHAEDFELVVGCGHVGGGVERCVGDSLLSFSLQLMSRLSFFSRF